MTTAQTASTIRKYHRMLGFFLAGIMMIYATSGMLLVLRSTDFLKYEHTSERQLAPGLPAAELGQQLRLRGFQVQQETADRIRFGQGSYDRSTGVATVTEKAYPLLLQKIVKLHKASTDSPLFFMNLFFGAALLLFAISSFFMFIPKAPVYRTGLKIAGGGFVLALTMVLMS